MVESRPFISATASCAGNGNWMMPTGSMGWVSIDGVLCLDAESARVSDGWCDDPMSGADDGRITGCDAEEANGPLARGCMFSRGSGVSVSSSLRDKIQQLQRKGINGVCIPNKDTLPCVFETKKKYGYVTIPLSILWTAMDQIRAIGSVISRIRK